MPPTFRRSPLALAVLCILETGPLHPYAIQRLLKEWGKENVINTAQRATLYKTIGRLHEAGLVAVHETARDTRYPERTEYRLTDEGRTLARTWIAEMIAAPREEYPEFPAALSFAMLLEPAELRRLLGERRTRLAARCAELAAAAEPPAGIPRVVLLDDEYRRAVAEAELRWLDGILAALDDSTLTWDEDSLRDLADTTSRAAREDS